MNFQITSQDLWSFKYKRNVHLLSLLCLSIMDLVGVVQVIVSNTTQSGAGAFGWLIGGLLFVSFWFMRPLECLDGCFPAFQYVTLAFEYVFHCVGGVYNIAALMFEIHKIMMDELKLSVVFDLVFCAIYTLLLVHVVYKTSPVVITFCTIDAEQLKRLQLDDEVRGTRPEDVTIENTAALTTSANSNKTVSIANKNNAQIAESRDRKSVV